MGRLGKDPEIRYTQGNEPMCIARYNLAVRRKFKRDGEPEADFIPCVAFGKAGEFAEKYLSKGSMIAISGRIQVRRWEDQHGQKRWATEVVIEEQDFAESKASANARNQCNSNAEQENTHAQNGFSTIVEDIDENSDLPF